MMNEEKLVTIARFPDSIKAHLAKQTLDDFGIKALLAGQNAANMFGCGYAAKISVQLQVFESQAERAREILESNEEQEQNIEDIN